MWKPIVVGTAALAIAGTSFVYAQQREGRDFGQSQRWRASPEDMRAYGEARLAALKAGLTLTPDQEKNWPAFEQAARDFGKVRMEQRTARRERIEQRTAPGDQPSSGPVDRLRQRATAMEDMGAAMKKLADAADPLYKSLDENQKRRFMVLSRLGGRFEHMRGREGDWRGREGDWRDRNGGGWRGREGWRSRDGDGGWAPRHTDVPMGQPGPGEERL